MSPKILLVNPPVYDFSAYDFWMKPYGMLRVAGHLRGRAELHFFDFMDRTTGPSDRWGRGEFPSEIVSKPPALATIPRRYRRFGTPRAEFQKFLQEQGPFDFALVQTVMTYWYPGVREVIENLRTFSPRTKIVLGGVYATLCPGHARGLNADLGVEGTDLGPLWRFLRVEPNADGLPLWDLYDHPEVGVMKLADGCPFKCTYCSVPQVYPKFFGRPLERSLAELDHLVRLGVRNIAFYDDALLFQPQKILIPFLHAAIGRGDDVHFHTPNALNARFITRELAELMVRAGFKTFYLGFESSAYEWQRKTGGKVYSDEFVRAVDHLVSAGAEPENITAYLIIAHPNADHQNVEASMQFAHKQGIRVMLSEFSPIPGTPDGEACRPRIDLDEPLWHNKTAWAIHFLGEQCVNELKELCRRLNRTFLAFDRRSTDRRSVLTPAGSGPDTLQ